MSAEDVHQKHTQKSFFTATSKISICLTASQVSSQVSLPAEATTQVFTSADVNNCEQKQLRTFPKALCGFSDITTKIEARLEL